MINIVEKFLEKYNLIDSKKTYILGFSGGYDSLCLLDILHKLSIRYEFNLVALHLNHNWRGAESLQDEQNCKKFCEINSIQYISETLPKETPKTESAAREARYVFFLKHAKAFENSIIFTAHNKTDNAETIIYRVSKGTGTKGLQGILPVRDLDGYKIYRPLLDISRTEIENYCAANGLIANTDSSNFDTTYKRNFIRQKIMPLLNEINLSAENAIVSLTKIAQSENNIIDEYLNIIKKDLYVNKKIISEKFMNLSFDVQQKIIYELCLDEKLDYDYKKISNILNFILENIHSKSGSRYSLTKNLWLFVSSKYIYLITKTKAKENRTELHIETEGAWGFPENKLFSLQKYLKDEKVSYPDENAAFAYVELAEIHGLTLRTRRDGDFIVPFGMNGTMKLKKYLNSKKIPQHKKDELILLCKGSEVLWVVGVGLSNKLKVVNKSTHVIELKNKD